MVDYIVQTPTAPSAQACPWRPFPRTGCLPALLRSGVVRFLSLANGAWVEMTFVTSTKEHEVSGPDVCVIAPFPCVPKQNVPDWGAPLPAVPGGADHS